MYSDYELCNGPLGETVSNMDTETKKCLRLVSKCFQFCIETFLEEIRIDFNHVLASPQACKDLLSRCMSLRRLIIYNAHPEINIHQCIPPNIWWKLESITVSLGKFTNLKKISHEDSSIINAPNLTVVIIWCS